MLDCVSMASLKPTIDYNNILIKAQFINIVALSDNGTHSERLACLKDSERYHTAFALSSYIVLISGSLLRLFIVKMFCCQKGFPETPETPPLYALVQVATSNSYVYESKSTLTIMSDHGKTLTNEVYTII